MEELPVTPRGHLHSKELCGCNGRNSIVSEEITDEAFPNRRVETHSSKFKQGSLKHRLSSNGRTCG